MSLNSNLFIKLESVMLILLLDWRLMTVCILM